MFDIESGELRVTILDPIEDKERFSPRFVTGGYIFRVTEKETGKILTTGPNWGIGWTNFDGEGMPETFHRAPIFLPSEGLHLIPGIGKCDLAKDEIVEPCVWKVEKRGNEAVFETEHKADIYDFVVRRIVKVEGLKIVSRTEMENRADSLFPVCWYPHPFLPPVKIGEPLFTFPENTEMLAPTGYYTIDEGKVRRMRGVGQEHSFQPFVIPGADHLEAVINGDDGYDFSVKSDFFSEVVPVWGNDYTCSIEPYLDFTLFQFTERHWEMEYEFIRKDR